MKLNKLISELGEIKKLLSEIIDTQLWINALNEENRWWINYQGKPYFEHKDLYRMAGERKVKEEGWNFGYPPERGEYSVKVFKRDTGEMLESKDYYHNGYGTSPEGFKQGWQTYDHGLDYGKYVVIAYREVTE